MPFTGVIHTASPGTFPSTSSSFPFLPVISSWPSLECADRLTSPTAGTILSIRSIVGNLSFSQRPLEGTHALLCFKLKGIWSSLENLSEAETSFLGFWGPKENLGLTCPYEQIYKHMDLFANVSVIFQKDTWLFSHQWWQKVWRVLQWLQ